MEGSLATLEFICPSPKSEHSVWLVRKAGLLPSLTQQGTPHRPSRELEGRRGGVFGARKR